MKRETGRITEFTDLLAWQENHKLVIQIYKLTDKLPSHQLYGLTSQMQRSAISITSNIAEGYGRRTYNEKMQFYYMAHGSLTELKNQLIISRDVGFITSTHFQQVMDQLHVGHKLLSGLIRKTRQIVKSTSRG